ncbi:MAG: C25 family cysteine peptidase [Patescibacteria group bacterium]|jgi:hypothetical protein
MARISQTNIRTLAISIILLLCACGAKKFMESAEFQDPLDPTNSMNPPKDSDGTSGAAPVVDSGTQLADVQVMPEVSQPSIDDLIVAPELFLASANALRQYRKDRGHDAQILTVQTAEAASVLALGNAIRTATQVLPHLIYITLIGDVSVLPAERRVFVGGGEGFTDTCYAYNGSETSLAPAYALGRIPVKSDDEFTAYLDKVRRFEETFISRKGMLFFGHQPELGYAETRDLNLANQSGFQSTVSSPSNIDELTSLLNNPAIGTVLYYGHGSLYGNEPLSILPTDSALQIGWNNVNAPVIYASGGCDFHNSQIGQRILSDQLIFSENGAAATVGAVKNGGYGFDYAFVPGFISGLAAEPTLGRAFLSGLHSVAAHPEAKPESVMDFMYREALHGDPLLQIR